MNDESLSELSDYLGRNLRSIRELRGLTQQQLADLCEIPRSTVANVEVGGSNPTLAVLVRLASSMHLSIEELLARPRVRCQIFPAGSLPTLQSKRGGGSKLRKLLPHPIPGMAIDRMELAAGARHTGSPHAPGTHEFLYCERGRIILWVGGEQFDLALGSVAAFPGDQRHSYENPGASVAIGFSVVSLAPVDNIWTGLAGAKSAKGKGKNA
jgi:transcriptional regulator with XRE-family HTH domain